MTETLTVKSEVEDALKKRFPDRRFTVEAGNTWQEGGDPSRLTVHYDAYMPDEDMLTMKVVLALISPRITYKQMVF